MCGHCGCHDVDAIRELVDEHTSLIEDVALVRAAMARGARAEVVEVVARMIPHLGTHVHREETGIFAALRDDGTFADEVDSLEDEHRDLDAAVAALHPDAPGFDADVLRLLDDLEQHIEREDLGVFPVAVVTLGRDGWDVVDAAHERTPSFLDVARTARV